MERVDKSLTTNYISAMSKGDSVISLISEIREKSNKIIIDELKKNGIEDLAPSHGGILVQLYQHGSLCMKDIAQKINKDKSTITALVNKLEKLGYIYKVKDKDDHRITHIKATEKSREIEHIFNSVTDVLMDKVYKGFEEEEKKTLKTLLFKMRENL